MTPARGPTPLGYIVVGVLLGIVGVFMAAVFRFEPLLVISVLGVGFAAVGAIGVAVRLGIEDADRRQAARLEAPSATETDERPPT